MLNEIMKYCRNYFVHERYNGTFTISDGALQLPLTVGTYILIEQSLKNDGVFVFGMNQLKDETFDGTVSVLAIPSDFLALAEEIENWQTANADKVTSPYQSESFGGYSYTKSTTASGQPKGWQSAFASRLKVWKKL